MNKSSFPYVLKEVYNTSLYWKCVIRKNLMTNIFKDVFIFPAEDIQEITPGRE